MEIQKIKDQAFNEAVSELKREYRNNLNVLKKIKGLEKQKK